MRRQYVSQTHGGAQFRWKCHFLLLFLLFSSLISPSQAQPLPVNGMIQSPMQIVSGPAYYQSPTSPVVPLPPIAPTTQVLPINLATALSLSQARPIVIAMAQASEEQAAAQLQGANSLWLPDLNVGTQYAHHDGANQATDGTVPSASFSSLYTGAGVSLNLGVTDALFQPLAASQALLARQSDVQAVCNDTLLAVAHGYFDIQEARGCRAGHLDAVAKGEELLRHVEALAVDLVPEIEVNRVRALLADFKQQAVSSETNWRVAGTRMTRLLRLMPGAAVEPQEPPQLTVTLISPNHTFEELIACGMTNRPELSSQRATLQASYELLRQERMRPLIPNVVVTGRGPNGAFNSGYFGGGQGGDLRTWTGQADVDLGLVWTLNNLGVGNRALVRGRQADQDKATLELAALQDRIVEEIVQALSQANGASAEIQQAEIGVREASVTFQGVLNGLTRVRGAGNMLQTVSRPQEAAAALQQLNRSYEQYFLAVNKYNRSQFLLFHALGYPSRILTFEKPTQPEISNGTARLPEPRSAFGGMSELAPIR